MASAVPEIDIVVNKDDYRPGLLEVLSRIRPDWKQGDIKFKFLQQGYINHMIACYVTEDQDDWIVARIFGTDVQIGFQREKEIKCSKLFSELKVGPPVYATFNNGICSGFVKGKAFFWNDLSPFRDIKLGRAVAREIARYHCKHTLQVAMDKYSIHKGVTTEEIVMNILNHWPEVIIDEETTKWYLSQIPSKEEREAEFKMVGERLLSIDVPKVVCHGDCNPSNIIYNEEEDKVTLVDYESSGISNPVFDVSGFLLSSSVGFEVDSKGLEHSDEYVTEFMRAYLREKALLEEGEERIDEHELKKLLSYHQLMSLGSDFFFHLFGPLLANAPERHIDPKQFLHIGLGRLKRYYEKRDEFIAFKVAT